MNQIAVKQYHRKHVNCKLFPDLRRSTVRYNSPWVNLKTNWTIRFIKSIDVTSRSSSHRKENWNHPWLSFSPPHGTIALNWELSDVSKGRKKIRKTLDFYLKNYLLFSFGMKLKIPPNVLRYREFHRIIPRRAKKRLRIVGYSNESHVCTKTIQLVLKHHNSLDNSCVNINIDSLVKIPQRAQSIHTSRPSRMLNWNKKLNIEAENIANKFIAFIPFTPSHDRDWVLFLNSRYKFDAQDFRVVHIFKVRR